MTDHDENAAIGSLTKEYSDAKRQKAALVSEITKARNALDQFSRQLQSVGGYSLTDPIKVPKVPADYPTAEKLAELLTDLRAAMHKIDHTQKLLKDAGVEVS
jgi:hypothetical protein